MGLISNLIDFFRRWGPRPIPPSPAPILPPPTGPMDARSALLEAHNRVRAQHGMNPLRADPRLEQMAYAFAQDLARRQTIDHANFQARLRAAGLDNVMAAENAAMGSPSVEHAMSTWMGSSGHRANILGDWTHMGGGMASSNTTYWTVDFARLP